MPSPVIGVVPLWDFEKDSYWMLPGYMEGIRDGGGLPVMLPLTDNEDDLRGICSLCGGFLLTGGQDISPSLYGEEPSGKCGEVCPRRDAMESALLRMALDRKKSVFGICRGMQFINVFFGGTLYQDLPSEHPSGVIHHQAPPYERPSHSVALIEGTPLEALLSAKSIDVNSYHHQAIRRLSRLLSSMAVAPDGIVEAVWLPAYPFLWGVQWHPEFSYKVSEESRAIFRAFCLAAACS